MQLQTSHKIEVELAGVHLTLVYQTGFQIKSLLSTPDNKINGNSIMGANL